jgi:hypothetical protein
MDGQQFVQLLQGLLEPNTEVVKKSTAELKKYISLKSILRSIPDDKCTEITTLTPKP